MEFKFSLFEIQENLICSSFFKEYDPRIVAYSNSTTCWVWPWSDKSTYPAPQKKHKRFIDKR